MRVREVGTSIPLDSLVNRLKKEETAEIEETIKVYEKLLPL